MNADFTKVELSVIHLAIVRDMKEFELILKGSSSMIALRDKIETMMDNYCEHESDGNIYTSLPPKMKCVKCKEFYL